MKQKSQSFQPVIGLEIHVELKTESKMFCGCSADHFGKKPNTQVCPVCLGLPGALPVINRKAVEQTILVGLGLGCKVNSFSKFDRKNYFYPDLAKGYQISQYDSPFCRQGQMGLVDIRRVHLEEDTAKMIHRGQETYLDFNRSGVPLMEIVTEPDLHNPQEAKEFLRNLQRIIRYLGVSGADMEKGTMRIEPNISVRTPSSKLAIPDYKVEIKNINSFRFAEKALIYEIIRQTKLLKKGQKPRQETRGWDEKNQETYLQRTKEEAQDYRYFPEPDLPPMKLSKKQINQLRNQLPELPSIKASRLGKDFGIPNEQTRILTKDQNKAAYFEKAAEIGLKHEISAATISKMIINKKVNINKVSPDEFIENLVKKQSRSLLAGDELEKIIRRVIADNKKAAAAYQKGKLGILEFLVGQVMAATQGRSDPQQVRKLIKKTLK